jgi:DNA-binding transcriptional MerR regulator
MKKENNLKKVLDVFIEMESNPIEFMRNTKFKRSELGLDPRVANHWSDKGLFPTNQVTGAWLLFNLSEAFWVKIIMKLREFNVSLDVIKKIKESFFTEPQKIFDKYDKKYLIQKIKESNVLNSEHLKHIDDDEIWKLIFNIQLSDFEIMIQSILLQRKLYFLILDNHDKALLLDETHLLLETNQNYLKEYEEITQKSHIRISMNEILGDLVKCLGDLKCSEKIPILTKKEAEIIRLLRTENISKIEIRFKNNSEAEIVEITTQNLISEKARLNDVIISRGYQNITIKTQNGQIVFCENTTKHKLDTV